jgi:hypothetical protein
LRKEASALGAAVAEGVGERLADSELWHGGPGGLPSTRDLRQVAHIWSALGNIDEQVEELAKGVGLGGDDREPAGYGPPARFIGGQHLPTLVETYMRELGTLHQLDAEAAQAAAVAQERSLTERWARAGEEG